MTYNCNISIKWIFLNKFKTKSVNRNNCKLTKLHVVVGCNLIGAFSVETMEARFESKLHVQAGKQISTEIEIN